ncbi:MAG: hypothetical protein KC502_19550 [Myxococcales bacterium]|nr:hypothetical protein [Myxococcales bacterium]
MSKPPPKNVRFGKVQRLGARQRWTSDLYVRLIDGSWWGVIGTLSMAWLMCNIMFAALYLAGGDCISGAAPGDFGDAFNFSVQTLSTIGFGGMAPKTPWANGLVTIEALVGLLIAAMATGLIFAKFSRPRANTLFSSVAVINRWQGQPCLMFRVANRRGNDVVEASMRVAVLKNEVTAEGHQMRRLHDLKLMRSNSPVFTLSWTIIHLIDEDSPLWGLSAATVAADSSTLIVTLTGFDGTYMQTIHARHTYYCDQLRWGHRFVDVIGFEDGAPVLDFTAFHHTVLDDDAQELAQLQSTGTGRQQNFEVAPANSA